MNHTGKIFFHFNLIVFSLLVSSGNLLAQTVPLKDSTFKIVFSGNRYFPSIAQDGRIVFQSNQNGNENIYLFNPITDSTVQITSDTIDEQHPVWLPHKNAIVFDAGKGKNARLFYLDLETGKKHLLLHRHIACREASFTPSRHLVAFSGFDDRTQRWQIFTYDFIYDNLNRLTDEKGNCSFPVFSPDGKSIVFTVYEDNGISRLKIMNWYGDNQKVLVSNITGRACWTPDSWRILFLSKDGGHFNLYSIINDGTGLKMVKSEHHPFCSPALSADGKKLIFSVKNVSKSQIISYPEKAIR
jgi:Tol biopolymer transport system component